jgi:hypothetical protein
MKWIEPTIDQIQTSGIIYFSEELQNECKRICKVLKIDNFPDISGEKFWLLSGNKWKLNPIEPFQRNKG